MYDNIWESADIQRFRWHSHHLSRRLKSGCASRQSRHKRRNDDVLIVDRRAVAVEDNEVHIGQRVMDHNILRSDTNRFTIY